MFRDDMTLGEARRLLRDLVEDGATCPCCRRLAKIYRRKINSTQARDLIAMYRYGGTEFAYLPHVRKASGGRSNREEPKLRWWGLVEEEPTLRPDGGRAGWWRVTERGVMFVRCQITVPKYAREYDGRCLRLLGDPITIRDALGTKFNYDDLMAGI